MFMVFKLNTFVVIFGDRFKNLFKSNNAKCYKASTVKLSQLYRNDYTHQSIYVLCNHNSYEIVMKALLFLLY